MEQTIDFANHLDDDGNPAGGYVDGVGLHIEWQDGPLGRGEDRLEPNGAFVETVIGAAKQRIEHYQETKFACKENATAIDALNNALTALRLRTSDREHRDVEGTHTV